MSRSYRMCTLVLLLASFFSVSCASVNTDDYQKQSPPFVLEEFFDGQVTAWGIVQNRKGQVTQRFKVNIDGSFVDQQLTLNETFEYSLGEGVVNRVWTIDVLGDGHYKGVADDILPGATGRSFGNAFNWNYQMDLPVGKRTFRVRFDDWFWAFDESTIMNKALIKKFGVTVAEVTLFMQRQ